MTTADLDLGVARADWVVARLRDLERDYGFGHDPRAADLQRQLAHWLIGGGRSVVYTGDPVRDALIADIWKTRVDNMALEAARDRLEKTVGQEPDLC